MTTEDFERAQLRLDIENRNVKGVAQHVSAEDAEEFRQQLQAYFERRD